VAEIATIERSTRSTKCKTVVNEPRSQGQHARKYRSSKQRKPVDKDNRKNWTWHQHCPTI